MSITIVLIYFVGFIVSLGFLYQRNQYNRMETYDAIMLAFIWPLASLIWLGCMLAKLSHITKERDKHERR